MDAQAARPPFGDLMTADHDLAIRYHTTSGTSGRVPLRVLDGPKDWGWTAEMWAYGFWGFENTPLRSCVFCILIRCLYRLLGRPLRL